MRRVLHTLLAGITLLVLVPWRVQEARAQSSFLNATPQLLNSTRSDRAPVMPAGCTFDATPVIIGDSKYQMMRCQNTGELLVAPAAGAITDINYKQLAGTAVEGPYDVNGGAGNERVTGVSVRTLNAAGASVEGVNQLLGGVVASTGAGVVGAQVQRFTLADNDPAVVDLAALEVLTTALEGDTSAIQLAIEIIDDWDEANRAAVNIIPGQVGVAAAAGAVDALTQRVTLGTTDGTAVNIADIEALLTSIDVDTSAMVVDLAAIEVLLTTIEGDTSAIQAAVQILDNIVAGNEAQVDIVTEPATAADAALALPAVVKVVAGWDGTNVRVWTLDAAGHAQVDVLTSALPAGAATEVTLATLATQATLASVLADTATIDSQTLAIKTAVEIIDNIVAGAEAQVDVITSALPTGAATEATLATLATQATLASVLADTATIDSQTLAIQAAVELIDNIVAGGEAQVDVITEPATAADGALGLPATLKVIAGWDGTNVQAFSLDASGNAQVDILTSALPTGAATEATLATLATQATLASVLADTATIDTQTLAIQTAVEVLDNIVAGNEAQVDVVTSALPAGAATEATLATRAASAQLPAGLGQTTAANSLPVVLPSDVVHEFQGDQVSPSTQTTVACDDTGGVGLTFQAGTMRAEIWNTSASDVCLRWGTAGVPDRGSLVSCSLVLGAHGGSGTSEVYITPADFRVGGEAFECDTVAAPGNVVVVEWVTQ